MVRRAADAVVGAVMAGKCGHGQSPGSGSGDITVSGSDEKKVAAHEKKCRGAHVFWHQGLLFKVVCCATCGRKIL